MATALHSDSRRLYSWWWDSHISPKSSRWLQENLTDMDVKVKAMIKLIEEDADSFARRAEMYYKKRPELMKLVEEFYRAYRALAERYDYATVELRQAHKTMAEAFPNQLPFMLSECSPSGSSPPGTEPQTPEMPHPIRALFDPDELHKDALGLSPSDLHSSRRNGSMTDESESGMNKGLKQVNFMFRSREGFSQLSNENQNLIAESDQGSTETVVQTLKEALAEIKAEKEALFLQYQQNLERLAILDRELNHVQNDASMLDQRACKAETEANMLREALLKLEAERDVALHQHKQCLEKMSNLETMNSLAIKAETEAQNLKLELLRLEAEKEQSLLQHKQCVEKVCALEDKISDAEEDAQKLIEQTIRAETEVQILKQALAESNEEKEAIAMQYKRCLKVLSELEDELSRSNEDVKGLDSKLKSAEERCVEWERLNHSLQLEVDTVAKRMVMKDQELLQKNEELEKLQVCVQKEHSRLLQVEATLQNLQNMQSQSQEEHRALVWEVKNGLQLLKDSEKCKQELEREIQRINKENRSLNDLNLSSTILVKDMQNETFNLRKTKGKLEVKVAEQLDQIKALQRDIYHLREEIKGLNRRYQALVEQLESVGLNPNSAASSVKALQDENSKLKDFCEKDRDEKEALLEKLENMEILLEKNASLESCLLDVTIELEGGKEKVKLLEESYQSLLGEKAILVAEKSALFSQLQTITDNMQNLMEKNSKLEVSFSAANAELENLQAKSKSLEESCHLFSIEKSNLLAERKTLVSQLEIIEKRLENLEMRFKILEDKYSSMEKEKEYMLCQVEELQVSLGVEKQERATFMLSSEARLLGLENHVHVLQEESRRRQKEFEEELEKAVNAQLEIFILQKCTQDMEENNFSLLMECHKHNEESKLSEKMISELESENLEQQVELEFLLDEIKSLKKGIYKIFGALQTDQDNGHEKEPELVKVVLPEINRSIENMKSSLMTIEDEKHKLLVENSVLYILMEELRIQGRNLESGHKAVNEGLLLELIDLQENYHGLQKRNSKATEEYASLLRDFFELKEEQCLLEEENSDVFKQAISFSNLWLIYSSFGAEKAAELKAISDDLGNLQMINSDLRSEVEIFRKKLEKKEVENSHLKKSVEKLDKELYEARESLGKQIVELSKQGSALEKEVECLHEVKGNLESERCMLRREIDECRIREENLNSELREKSYDSELWEAEAAKFYFDLQISFVREVLSESKVHELTSVCESLEDKSALKNAELEQMKERVSSLECEVKSFKEQLSAYDPVINSLKDNIASLERNAHFRTKQSLDDDQKQQDEEAIVDFHEVKTAAVDDGISDLQKMQIRIKAVEKAVVEEMKRLVTQESVAANSKLETVMNGGRTPGDEARGDLDLMKDIPLDRHSDRSFNGVQTGAAGGTDDQMLELWETAQDFRVNPRVHETQTQASAMMDNAIGNASSEVQLEKDLSVDKVEISTQVTLSPQETANTNILEKLASNSQKLQSLQTTVQDLKRKMEQNKKSKRVMAAEYETVEEQLQETEEAVVELSEINAELTTDVEESRPSSSDGEEENAERKSISEKAQKGSEKIGRLQLEVQKIQYVLLKLKDEKKSKGKNRVSESRTSGSIALFRGFSHSDGRKKKSCFCGFLRPSSPDRDQGKQI